VIALAVCVAVASDGGVAGAADAAAPAIAGSSDVGLRLVLAADLDDDDVNGAADGDEPSLGPLARTDLVPLPAAYVGAVLHPIAGGTHARLVAFGKPVPWDTVAPAGAQLQGRAPGLVSIVAQRGAVQEPLVLDVRAVRFRDGRGADIDPVRSHASLVRTPPSPAPPLATDPYDDPDELRVVVEMPPPSGEAVRPPPLTVESLSATGQRIDELAAPQLGGVPCGSPGDLRCFATAPLRLVVDDVDRTHPLAAGRALRAEVGGAIVVRDQGRKLLGVRVLGPRVSPAGPIDRTRAVVRPFVFRLAAGSAPAIGGTDAGAVQALRTELALAAAVWGQCGVTIGEARDLDVKIVDPPPSWLLAIGDDLGVPASGGEIRLRAEGRVVVVPTRAGRGPAAVAYDVARALDAAGFVAIVSPNARIGPAASGSVDVLVRKRNGQPATLEPAQSGAPFTTDASLSVRVGSVDLSDGLQHFTDVDAVAGTLEERTLLKLIDDGDPQTIELVIVPSFTGGIRIGESFIGSDASSLRNYVLLDRAGVRARKSSLTLAHELGHVLLDMPDHPDDYGVDTPTLLMDSDASDASAFGPRRLTLADCARVIRESGPKARTPLLSAWPIGPLRIHAVAERAP
jgi:hypothetical protein